ncbi:MAG: hypothetical protein P8164_02095 [Gammaproteobacteria bacterium]|jgi:hypothetical protein
MHGVGLHCFGGCVDLADSPASAGGANYPGNHRHHRGEQAQPGETRYLEEAALGEVSRDME